MVCPPEGINHSIIDYSTIATIGNRRDDRDVSRQDIVWTSIAVVEAVRRSSQRRHHGVPIV
jgi:hypothetical protein